MKKDPKEPGLICIAKSKQSVLFTDIFWGWVKHVEAQKWPSKMGSKKKEPELLQDGA